MPKTRSLTASIICAAIFIVMEVAAFVMLSKNGSLQGIWIDRASHWVMAKLWGSSEDVKYYFSLKEQNEVLAEENAALADELRRYRAMELSESEIAHSDSLTHAEDFVYIPASIVKASRNRQHNYIILNKGSEDGVRPQSGIITSRGIVGIIDAVGKHYSYGITLMNANISISSRLGTEGAVGPLAWDGHSSGRALLKEIPLQYRFEPGDTVWSSGFSSLFPADIPLGVTGSSKVINGAVNEIEVNLFQDFKTLRFVTIVCNESSDEISWLESADEDTDDKKEGKK